MKKIFNVCYTGNHTGKLYTNETLFENETYDEAVKKLTETVKEDLDVYWDFLKDAEFTDVKIEKENKFESFNCFHLPDNEISYFYVRNNGEFMCYFIIDNESFNI